MTLSPAFTPLFPAACTSGLISHTQTTPVGPQECGPIPVTVSLVPIPK